MPIEFIDVSSAHAGRPVLRDIALTVPDGGLFGLVGANGAGKSTLLKCLLDFIRPDRGCIRIDGIDATRTDARARMAFLPERFQPPAYLTGDEFLRHMERLRGQQQDPVRLASLAELLDLPMAVLKQPVHRYSKGMTQKLGLLAVVGSEAAWYVLDEPMSGLDPRARAGLRAILNALHASGRGVLFTCHALADVDALCDGVVVMDEGRLRYSGTPSELLQVAGTGSLEAAYMLLTDRASGERVEHPDLA